MSGHLQDAHLEDGDEVLGHGHSEPGGGEGPAHPHRGGGGPGLPLPDAPVPGQFSIFFLPFGLFCSLSWLAPFCLLCRRTACLWLVFQLQEETPEGDIRAKPIGVLFRITGWSISGRDAGADPNWSPGYVGGEVGLCGYGTPIGQFLEEMLGLILIGLLFRRRGWPVCL